MVDHKSWARARAYRGRAAKCEDSARNTTSTEFSNCYLALARYYGQLAEMEEDFFKRDRAMQLDGTVQV